VLKQTATLALLRQLCALRLPAHSLMPAVLRTVRALVPCDSAAFFWVDPDGHIENFYAERLLAPQQIRSYFSRHYAADSHAFRDGLLARAARADWTIEVNAGETLAGTAYFEEILKPLNAYRILQGIVHDRGLPLGQVSLYRGARAKAFSKAESAALTTAGRYLVQMLTADGGTTAMPTGSYRDSGEEALVLCNSAGVIAYASPRAFALLVYAAGDTLNRRTLSGPIDRTANGLLRQVVRLVLEQPPLADVPAEIIVTNAWGQHRLRGYALGDEVFGVMVHRQEHLLVRMADAMRRLPLSAQQREVALLLAQGRSNQQIAAAMAVSINTASYHVKQLFAKLDAHDRNAAIARILDGHTARR
jgi:DNA-binding CsgD family transcriptional regulator